MTCDLCGTTMPDVGYVGEETCPGCGAVWTYDEGAQIEPESIKALLARAKADAMEECAKLAEEVPWRDPRWTPGRSDAVAKAIRARAEEMRAGR